MKKKYLKIAFRNLIKNRLYSLTNIFGLAIGISTCIIILSYIDFEHSYDKFHSKHERIYRIRYERYSDNGESVCFASCCPPVGLRIREHLPEVECVGRTARYPASVSHGEICYIEEKLFYAEPDLFRIFDFTFIKGDPKNGINAPNTAFLSQSAAIRYFGTENPIGKSISIDKKTEYQVTGIFEDMPQNSHIKMDIVVPWANLLKIFGDDFDGSWGDSGAYTYLLFAEGADIPAFQKKIDDIAMKEFGEILKNYKLTMTLPIQKLADIHLTSHYQQEFETNGDKTSIDILLIVAIFIIVIAWVNYINLSTAQSLTRAKEVGLRKVIGVSRMQLAFQFFIEIALINLFAMVLSVILILLSQPLFEQIIGKSFGYSIVTQLNSLYILLVMLFVGVFFAGLYPVAVLSSFQPIQVLKGKLLNNPQGVRLRKILVVFQFILALGLLMGTFAIYKQIRYMKDVDLGFTIDKIVAVKAPRVYGENHKSNISAFKQEMLKNANISQMCVLTETPGKQIYWDAGGIFPVGSDESKNYQIVGIDYDFVDLFNVHIIEGRNFSLDFPSDTLGLILNETAVRWMGFPDNQTAVGKQVNYWDQIYTIVGVMKDYHQQSPKAAFEPHLYRLMPHGRGNRGMFAFKLKSDDFQESIATIQTQYNTFFPGNSFDYFYLPDYFNKQYSDDLTLGRVLGIFAILALIVTVLGILGLYSFMVSQRLREISIRTVLGASGVRVLKLFAKEFIVLLLISFILVAPILYYAINQWLSSFAAQMEIGLAIFIFPFIIVFIVAVVTIATQVVKAIRTNPVENLRFE